MTTWHVLVAIFAALIGFMLTRGFGGRKVTETDHTAERPSVDIVDDALQQRIVQTLNSSGKIQAVKELKDATGWGLKQSKDFVDGMEQDTSLQTPEPGEQTPVAVNVAAADIDFDDLDRDGLLRVMAEIREGRKINAIKEMREMTGLGLKEAKDLVEEIERSGLHL